MEENFITTTLKIDLQYPDWFKKGDKFLMDRETSEVFALDKEKNTWNDMPLRGGISGYLWMLKLEGNKYLKEDKA